MRFPRHRQNATRRNDLGKQDHDDPRPAIQRQDILPADFLNYYLRIFPHYFMQIVFWGMKKE